MSGLGSTGRSGCARFPRSRPEGSIEAMVHETRATPPSLNVVPHSAWRNYAVQIIRSFRCPDTERLAQGWVVPQFQAFERVARRKLRQLEIAGRLDDLRIPPGNRLEALRGDRAGQHSIRINDQFRLCFNWTDAGPEAVELVDYN